MKALSDIAEVIRGIAFPKEARTNITSSETVACLRTTNVQRNVEWDDLWFVPPTYVKHQKQYLQVGDTLISTANSLELVGKVAHLHCLPQKATLGAFIAAIRPKEVVLPKYLYLALAAPSSQEQIRSTASTTTNISNISVKQLLGMQILLPPLPTQHRIVQALEEKLSRLDAAQTALLRAAANLKRYRASVLAQACHLDSAELPVSWKRAVLGELATVGTGSTPKRDQPNYWDNGNVPWVTSGAVNEETVSEASAFITAKALKETNCRVYPAGTLLVAMYGEGKTRGMCSELGIPAATNQALAAIQTTTALRPYLKLALQAAYEQTRRSASGGVQPNLNLSLVRAIPIAVPPEHETQKIVAEVERHLTLITRTEQSLQTQLARAKRLRQAILQQAFAPGST